MSNIKVNYYYRYKSTSNLVMVLSADHSGYTKMVYTKRVLCRAMNGTQILEDIDDFIRDYKEYNP